VLRGAPPWPSGTQLFAFRIRQDEEIGQLLTEGETKLDYTYIVDLAKEVNIPSDGILSRTLYSDEHVKVLVFGFDAGQELSEHTVSTPAVLHMIQGEARLTLGDDSVEARAGAWVHMPSRLPHSVQARTSVIMLLLMMKSGTEGNSNRPS
jgi:quercetin dioxygenase-like cupin family protein